MTQTTSSRAPEFVSSYLLYLLAASSEKASAQFHAVVRQKGLRVPEWRVLACLHDAEGLMVTRLADLCLMEQSRMTRIIDQMDRRGLLQRAPDAQDRRKVRVSLSPEGRRLADELVEIARAHEARLLSVFEDTDAARIKPVLQALLHELGEAGPDAVGVEP